MDNLFADIETKKAVISIRNIVKFYFASYLIKNERGNYTLLRTANYSEKDKLLKELENKCHYRNVQVFEYEYDITDFPPIDNIN